MIKSLLLTASLSILIISGNSQSVAINADGSAPHSTAMLDVKSTTKGMLVPRMTSAQRTAIASPAAGLLVYETTSNSYWFYNGTSWIQMGAGGGSSLWSASGANIYNTNAREPNLQTPTTRSYGFNLNFVF